MSKCKVVPERLIINCVQCPFTNNGTTCMHKDNDYGGKPRGIRIASGSFPDWCPLVDFK